MDDKGGIMEAWFRTNQGVKFGEVIKENPKKQFG